MGNMPFNPACMSMQKNKHETCSSTTSTTKSYIINTDSTVSAPFAKLASSSAPCFPLQISISKQVIDLQHILSNYSNTDYTILLSNLLSKYSTGSDSSPLHEDDELEHKYTAPPFAHCQSFTSLSMQCDQHMTFYFILKEFYLIPLFELNLIKFCSSSISCTNHTSCVHTFCYTLSKTHTLSNTKNRILIIDECGDEQQVGNFDETVFNVLLKASADSQQSFTLNSLHIVLPDDWYHNKLPKIRQIETLIHSLTTETRAACKKLKYCKSINLLRVQHDIINNDILSKFVDIDQLIDEHGNEIANVECSVLPYLSTNKTRMLKLLTTKLHKMDQDLKHIKQRWSVKSNEIEKYSQTTFNKALRKIESNYKLWSTELVLEWIQWIIRDNVTFDQTHVAALKVSNIAGINLHDLDEDTLDLIGVENDILQNIVITCIFNLIEKYDKDTVIIYEEVEDEE